MRNDPSSLILFTCCQSRPLQLQNADSPKSDKILPSNFVCKYKIVLKIHTLNFSPNPYPYNPVHLKSQTLFPKIRNLIPCTSKTHNPHENKAFFLKCSLTQAQTHQEAPSKIWEPNSQDFAWNIPKKPISNLPNLTPDPCNFKNSLTPQKQWSLFENCV